MIVRHRNSLLLAFWCALLLYSCSCQSVFFATAFVPTSGLISIRSSRARHPPPLSDTCDSKFIRQIGRQDQVPLYAFPPPRTDDDDGHEKKRSSFLSPPDSSTTQCTATTTDQGGPEFIITNNNVLVSMV